jgi:hypothetical protein
VSYFPQNATKLINLISFGSHNIKVFCKPCEKFKWLAEKNVVREGGLWVFKYGRQKAKSVAAFTARCSY